MLQNCCALGLLSFEEMQEQCAFWAAEPFGVWISLSKMVSQNGCQALI